jgi:hypothetical protein
VTEERETLSGDDVRLVFDGKQLPELESSDESAEGKKGSV